MAHKKYGFLSPSMGKMTRVGVIQDIAQFVSCDSKPFYKLVIGTDSQTKSINGKAEIDFATALIIHRVGHGAKIFLRKHKKFIVPVLREKIYAETQLSLDMAQSIVPDLQRVLDGHNYELEIHLDVGPNGQTRDIIREVVGMVNGSGYRARTKPNGWGASTVADKYA
ncbi:ribonuclease H-like YkuK family protein [Patescibacteria group bacterium]